MKFLVALFMAFSSLSAIAAPWIQVSADRENLLYLEGESAHFVLRQLQYPSDPDFSMEVSVVDGAGEHLVEMPFLVGTYHSAPLAEGMTEILFRAKLKGPAGWEKVVQETELQLRVNEEE
jgi:hypothetical protein